MRYLDRDTVVYINRRTIQAHGGNFQSPDNMLNEDRLAYALEIVKSEVFGTPVYSQEYEVAAAYMFYMVTGHVFTDGNKRTGLEAALLFLAINGLELSDHPAGLPGSAGSDSMERSMNAVLVDLTLDLAAGRVELTALTDWFARSIRRKS